MTREELVDVVEKLRRGEYESERQRDEWLTVIESAVGYREVSDLIFYPEREMTSEEIVDVALSSRPIQL